MEFTYLESVLLKILKRVMLLAIGSGLLGNALYIYGLGYYQGYVETLGFEYNLFPIEWTDTLLWTYAASMDLGVSSLELINKFTTSALLILLLCIYLIARMWMAVSNYQTKNAKGKPKINRKINFRLAKKIHKFRLTHIWLYRLFYVPLRWLLLKEQSFFAFAASYFFIVFLISIPLFIIIWIYFPLFGINHGQLVAQKKLKYYETYLCGDSGDYWSQCLEFNVSELKSYEGLINPEGRVLFRNKSLIAILTKEGPITLSMPKHYYYKPDKNPCYKDGCKKSEDRPHKKSNKKNAQAASHAEAL